MNRFLYALVALQTFLASTALAADGSADPFAVATDKATKFTDYMTGTWAVAFFGLIIAGAGFAWAIDMLSKKWAINIAGGAIIVGSCTYLAGFFLN